MGPEGPLIPLGPMGPVDNAVIGPTVGPTRAGTGVKLGDPAGSGTDSMGRGPALLVP